MSNRDRAWRRFQYYNKGNDSFIDNIDKPEKNWKLLGIRSCKRQRAKQLGFEYPRKNCPIRQLSYE